MLQLPTNFSPAAHRGPSLNPVILIARPRSGTTAFRLVVSRHHRVTTVGEIFHSSYAEQPSNFYNYYLAAVTKRPELALPEQQHRIDLFDGYIKQLARELKPRYPQKDWVFLGVNYNSLHALNAYWQNIYEPPYLVRIIQWKQYPVVHIIRRNILAAAISEMRAKATGVWHIKEGEERPAAADATITVNPADLLLELRARKLEIDMVRAGLRGHKRCLTLFYEELFDSGGQPVPEQLARVSRLLDLDPPIAPIATYERTRSQSLRAAIENYDDVAAAVAKTEFARLLDAEAARTSDSGA
jgi:hypothetical protein